MGVIFDHRVGGNSGSQNVRYSGEAQLPAAVFDSWNQYANSSFSRNS
jgi:hypothetical protein